MPHEAQGDQQQTHAFDGQRHVFVVRIWLEPREIAGATVEWRGVIEHLPSQVRRYLNDLAAIEHFINPYLDSMGVISIKHGKRGWPGQLERWLNRWNQFWQSRR